MSLVMSSREMADFLSESNMARIATVKPDSSPHVSPVWYLWEDNQLLISVGKESVKARNISRNNMVSVTIDKKQGGVIVEGTARIEDLGEDTMRKICKRYVSKENLNEYIEHAWENYESILLRIQPNKIISWDFRKDPFRVRVFGL